MKDVKSEKIPAVCKVRSDCHLIDFRLVNAKALLSM